MVFFNQVLLHHPACLDPKAREAFQYVLPEGQMPREVRFGDGSSIPEVWIDEMLETYVQAATCFQCSFGG